MALSTQLPQHYNRKMINIGNSKPKYEAQIHPTEINQPNDGNTCLERSVINVTRRRNLVKGRLRCNLYVKQRHVEIKQGKSTYRQCTS